MCVITGSTDDNANHSRALSSGEGGGQTELEAAGLLGAGPVAGRERQARDASSIRSLRHRVLGIYWNCPKIPENKMRFPFEMVARQKELRCFTEAKFCKFFFFFFVPQESIQIAPLGPL